MGQPNFNSYGGYPMGNGGMLPNQNVNNMMQQQLNMEWFQNAMRSYTPPPMFMNPGMAPAMNPLEFFAAANSMMAGNMYRNSMGQLNPAMTQSMGNMNPSMTQSVSNMNPSMSQSMNPMNPALLRSMNNMSTPMGQSFQSQDSSKGYDQGKIEDVLANNMNNLNQFYSYINNQNKDLMTGMNLGSSFHSQSNPTNPGRQNDLNESGMYLPNKTEFIQPIVSNNEFQSMDSTPGATPHRNRTPQPQFSNVSNNENLNTDPTYPQHSLTDLPGNDNRAEPAERTYTNIRNNKRNATEDDHNSLDRRHEEAPPTFEGRESAQHDEAEKPQRSKNAWEDAPIKSIYISRRQEEEELSGRDHDDHDRSEYRSKNSLDGPAYQDYKNPYDDVQVKGHKRFEDLLEEQLRLNPDAVGTVTEPIRRPNHKKFLKKGTRNSLATSTVKPAKTTENQKENIANSTDRSGFQSDSGIITFPANTDSKSSLKPNHNFSNQDKRISDDKYGPGASNQGNQTTPNQKNNKPKASKKFLTRGAGRGGGVGNSTPGANEKSRKSLLLDEPVEKHEDIRPKSVSSKGRRDSKRQAGEEGQNKASKPDKSHEKTKGNYDQGRVDSSYYNEENNNDNQSFEREYNQERYMKRSPKEAAKMKKIDAKIKQSPKTYQFDDGGEDEEEERGRGREREGEGEEEEEEAEPTHGGEMDDDAPISNLVNKYFYKNKAEKARREEESESAQNDEDEKIQKIANEKVEMLNSELAKFKLENERVKKIRQKHEEMLKNLNKDIAEWNKQKEKDIKEFEDWKQEETKKIKNEKKLSERQQKTLSNMPNRKEREEIDNLKKQIAKLTEDLQTKDKRTKLNVDRFKRQIEELEQRNTELVQELRCFDQYKGKAQSARASNASNENRGSSSARNGTMGAVSNPTYANEDEEENEEDDEFDQNKHVIEERGEDEEEEEDHANQEASDEEDGSDNGNLRYEDIVNQPGGKAGNNQALSRFGPQSPKFSNEIEKKVDAKLKEKNVSLAQHNRGSSQQSNTQSQMSRQQTESLKSLGKGNDEGTKIISKVKQPENDYRYDSNPYFRKHFVIKTEPTKIVSQTVAGDGKVLMI